VTNAKANTIGTLLSGQAYARNVRTFYMGTGIAIINLKMADVLNAFGTETPQNS